MTNENNTEYSRIKGKGITAIFPLEVHELWQGKDHFLQVIKEGYNEYYKRFYFKDIQAILVHKTSRRSTISRLLSAVALSLAFVGLVSALITENPVLIVLLPVTLAAPFVIAIVINIMRGPTCDVMLRTGVQQEQLYSLRRFKTAVATVQRMRATVEAAQGALNPEDARTAQDIAMAGSSATLDARNASTPLKTAAPAAPKPPRPYRSRIHLVTYCIWALNLPLILFALAKGYSGWFVVISLILLLMLLASSIAALVKQQGTTLARDIKALTWISTIYIIVFTAVSLIYGVIEAVNSMDTYNGDEINWGSPFDSSFDLITTLIDLFASACFSALGFSFFRRFRASQVPLPELHPSAPAPQPARSRIESDIATGLPQPDSANNQGDRPA